MGKYRYLLKNIGLLTLSSFATKLLSFFLVPLYTNILTTTEYGVYDLFYTTVGIMVPILTLNIQESVIRFALDKKYDREAIVTVATRYFLIACAITIAGVIVNACTGWNLYIRDYAVLFMLMFIMQALSGIVLAYVRGIDRIAELSVSSVIASAVTIGCNILFLVVLQWGLTGYFLANIIGPIIQCLYLMWHSRMLRDMHLMRKYSAETSEMLAYCKPMIANSIAWWINNASDRYVVIFFCGMAENGIYSVASKIPNILNIFQNIFNQAWTLSAVKDFDPEDRSGFFANTYRSYNCLMVLVASAIIVSDKVLARFLYAKDFYVAWRYVPWLTIAIVFGALTGCLGGVFSAVKDSKMFASSTIIGAVTNVILNIVLTPFMGPLGAAIATAICYAVVWVVRLFYSRRYIHFEIHLWRDVISYIVLVMQSVALLVVSNNMLMYGLLAGMFMIELLLYMNDIRLVVDKLRRRA